MVYYEVISSGNKYRQHYGYWKDKEKAIDFLERMAKVLRAANNKRNDYRRRDLNGRPQFFIEDHYIHFRDETG